VLDYVFLLNEKAKKVSEYSKLYTKEDGHILHTGIVSHTFLFLFFCLLKGNQEENSQVQQKQVKGREGQDRRSSSRNKKKETKKIKKITQAALTIIQYLESISSWPSKGVA
jgi:hypothetical protein